jgi:probable phosphoglycerate mutase
VPSPSAAKTRADKPAATILLVRHAVSTANEKGILAGRDNSVHLSEKGREQALLLANALRTFDIFRTYSSPIKRCRETMEPYLSGTSQQRKLLTLSGVQEMDYGSWSGKKLSTLSKLPLWGSIQRKPSSVRFPGGESFNEMAARAIESITDAALPGKTILVCSHGDVIKSLVASALGLHLDQFQKIIIDPASITRLRFVNGDFAVVSVNDTHHLPTLSGGKAKKGRGALLGGGAGL